MLEHRATIALEGNELMNDPTAHPVFYPGVSMRDVQSAHRGNYDLLSCAVPWCAGHNANAADDWLELTHRTAAVDLLGEPRVGSMVMCAIPFTAAAVDDPDQAPGVMIDFHADEELSLEAARDLAGRLRNAALYLETAIALHPGAR